MTAKEEQNHRDEFALLDDRPKLTIESDEFGRGEFVRRLAKLLDRPQLAPSLVVSLEEDFGFGKTSTLNFVKETLQSSACHAPVIIDFNPWIISGSSNLIEDFLFQVGASLAIKDPKNQELITIGKKLAAYSSVFSALKLVPGAEPWATIVQTVFEKVGESACKIGDLEDYSIETHRSEIQAAITAAERPIIVIIDDLDRLTPEEVCQMIQVVKVVSDFEGITYLLAFEHGYLEHALETLEIKRPDAYLEKIIQFRVSLPGVRTAKLEALFLEELKSLELKQQIPLEDYSACQIRSAIFGSGFSLLRNLRDVKRLMNNLHFLGDVALQHIQLWDLVALELIRLRSPSLWKFIKEHQLEITDDGTSKPLGTSVHEHVVQQKAEAEEEDKLRKKINELLKPLGHDADQLHHLIDVLFKRHVQIWDLEANIKPASGRVCFIENLASYFCYGVGFSGMENKRYFEFIQKESERDTIIESISDYDTACSFINTLSDVVSDAPMTNVPQGLSKLGDLAVNYTSAQEEFSIWQGGIFGFLCRYIQELFTYQTVIEDDIREMLKDASSLPVKVALCRAVSGGDPLIRTDQFREESRDLLLELITPEVKSKVFDETCEHLKKHPDTRPRWALEMVRLHHKSESEKVEEFVQGLLDEGRFLMALWLISTWGSIGGRVVLRVSDDELSRFGGREKFTKAIPDDLSKNLSQADNARLESFKRNKDLYLDSLEKPEMSLWSKDETE